MVHINLTPSHTTADETGKFFITHIVKYHGIPRSIRTDRDPRLSSALWAELCFKLDIKYKMTAAYWPQANGQTECANQAVKQIFRIAHDECLHWFDALDGQKWNTQVVHLDLHQQQNAHNLTSFQRSARKLVHPMTHLHIRIPPYAKRPKQTSWKFLAQPGL